MKEDELRNETEKGSSNLVLINIKGMLGLIDVICKVYCS